ncbi:MAG: YceD family protein [Synechococcus sp.]
MIPGLEPVPLRDLQALGAPRVWEVEGKLDDLESLTPVRGELQAEHRGNVLEVRGELQTIVSLCCDRCLNQFNQNLQVQTEELIWLGDQQATDAMAEAGLDPDSPDGLIESLDPRSSFEPERWAFEHLSLQLSVVNRCGDDCPGPPQTRDAANVNAQASVDPRWQALQQLRENSNDG